MKNAFDMNNELEQELKREITKLKNQRYLLRHVVEMVRDADNDCHLDGLRTIPTAARKCIDQVLDFVAGGTAK